MGLLGVVTADSPRRQPWPAEMPDGTRGRCMFRDLEDSSQSAVLAAVVHGCLYGEAAVYGLRAKASAVLLPAGR